MAATCTIEWIGGEWVQTSHVPDPSKGCHILVVPDPTTGVQTFQCAEQECDGTCGLTIVDTYDETNTLVKREGTCNCGG